MVQFGEYFATILFKKNCKNVHFYIKIKDILLLRTIFGVIGAYSPESLFIVQFGAFWSTFSENSEANIYEYLSSTFIWGLFA